LLDPNAGRINGMGGVTLPMAADYAVITNIFAGTAYVDLVNLITNENTYMGAAPAGSGTGTLSGGAGADWFFVVNNTNILGVTGTGADDPQTANAATATTGVEMSIPLSAIGSPTNGTSVCVFAIVTNNNGSWLSNQILPVPVGSGGGRPNYDNTKPNFATLQFPCGSVVLGPVGPTCHDPRFDINGDGFVNQIDFAAFQRCWTGPLGPGNILPGCECFDWNFAQRDDLINIEDFAVFQNCAQAAGVPALATCDDAP
ncbi:MAG: hypothetical protein HY718_19135, partial [Planctomycetes bacterium]|nr:hypothetical protein [Planctomycetota bacterium]